MDRNIQPHPEVEDNCFQILDLNEDMKEVTLKSFSTGAERMIEVSLAEDVEVIKNGLLEEDKELFCTLKEVMGKEFIGDFKLAIKVPPILRTPDQILAIIFSQLTRGDRLNCGLVTPRWGTLLPINKFVKCAKLRIASGGWNPITAKFHQLNIPNYPIVENDNYMRDRLMEEPDDENEVYADPSIPTFRTNNLKPLIDASLLEDVECLSVRINARSRMERHIQTTVAQQCCKLTEFNFQDKAAKTDSMESNWIWAKQVIAGNKQQLKRLMITTSLGELDSSSDGQIRECSSLQHLFLTLTSAQSVLNNLGYFPTSIISLSTGETTFTKSQLIRLASNFPHLQYGNFRVYHNHSDGTENVDEDEVDGNTILQVLNGLPSLQHLSLALGPAIKGGRWRCGCKKGYHLKNRSVSRFHNSDIYFPANGRRLGFERLQFFAKRPIR